MFNSRFLINKSPGLAFCQKTLAVNVSIGSIDKKFFFRYFSGIKILMFQYTLLKIIFISMQQFPIFSDLYNR